MLKERVREATVEVLRKAETELPSDVREALERAYEAETSETARMQLKAMLENVELAAKLQRPICQDTGIPLFFVRLGVLSGVVGSGCGASSVPLSVLREIEEGIREGVEEATEKIPLRGNVVHPFMRAGEKKESNVGKRIPHIHFSISEEFDGIEITVLPKGGGSENVSVFATLPPLRAEKAYEALKDFVLSLIHI